MLTYADVGERLVASAAERGLRVTIARLGMIVGDSLTGCCNAKDVYCRILIGFAQTQAFPRLAEGARMVRLCCVKNAHVCCHLCFTYAD